MITRPNQFKATSFSLIFESLALGFLSSGLAVSGCGGGEDHDIETKLGTVATHRAAHPHYPIVVFGDFGKDSQPVGIAVDAYSFYVHETTKPDPGSTVVNATDATRRLERSFEKSLKSIKTAEAANPPPKPPLPDNSDWKHAPHPKPGTFTIISRCGPKARTFDVLYDAKGTADLEQALVKIRPELLRDAALVVDDGLKMQNTAMKSLAPPNGFSLCTKEILGVQQGNRGVEPHMMGGPLLLAPVDKALVLKGFEKSIDKLLSLSAKLNPPPSTVHLVVDGPGYDQTFAIPLNEQTGKEKGVKAALDNIGAKIDELNKKAG